MSFIDFLSEFSYQRIIIGTTLIGACAGAMGVFLYLRRQSLLSDVIGSAATPGVMGIFLAATTRIGIDTTMAVVMSLFLGGGLVLLQVIQRSRIRGKGGMEELMFGNSATLTNLDVGTIAVVSIAVAIVMMLLWRPFTMMTFDQTLSQVSGLPLRWLSPLLLSLIVLAVVIGVKAVGLILMIAFAVFPPAAARQWSKTVLQMVLFSAGIGGVASVVGTYISVAVGKVPTGPVIVLVLTAFVGVSLVAAPRRSGVRGGARA